MRRKINTGYLLSQVTKSYAKKQEQLFKEKGINLSFEQYTIITTLANMGPLSQKNLARFSGRDFTSCSRIITTLERDGYIQRMINPHDKRGQIISNTKKSKELYVRVVEQRNKATAIMLDGLDEDERAINAMLEKMLINLK